MCMLLEYVCTTEYVCTYLTGSCECNSIGLGVPPGPKANKKTVSMC